MNKNPTFMIIFIDHHFYPVEFLNDLEASGLPKHEIKLLKG